MMKDEELFSIDVLAKEAICLICNKKITDLRRYSYHRHYKALHKTFMIQHGLLEDDEQAGPSRKIPKIEIRTSRNIFTSSMVELLTVHGLPLNILKYPAFQAITRPIEEGLKIKHLNPENTRGLLQRIAGEITKIISFETQGKMICLKTDAASRYDRDFLGVNVQFVERGVITIRTLALMELHERHTAVNLSMRLLTVLEPFGIDIRRVLTVTTDNASNMLSTVNRLRRAQDISFNDTDNLQDVAESGGDQEDNSEDESENERNAAKVEAQLNLIEPVLNGVRCAEHTLQLAVSDSLKHAEMKNMITEVRIAVKVLRKLPYKTMFVVSKKPIPKLDCITRWNSAFNMIQSLKKGQDFIMSLTEGKEDPIISVEMWEFITQFEEVFAPVAEATQRLQNDQTTFGDLFLIWEKCSYQLRKSNTKIASIVLASMDKRKIQLMTNKPFLAGIFFDQRINYRNSPFITNEEREIALVS